MPTPVADFSGTPVSGDTSFSVSFTDLSTNVPTAWAWTFGDGNNSTAQNPANVYTSPGQYTVSLDASNVDGTNNKTRTAYINVILLATPTDSALASAALTLSAVLPTSPETFTANDGPSPSLSLADSFLLFHSATTSNVLSPLDTFAATDTVILEFKLADSILALDVLAVGYVGGMPSDFFHLSAVASTVAVLTATDTIATTDLPTLSTVSETVVESVTATAIVSPFITFSLTDATTAADLVTGKESPVADFAFSTESPSSSAVLSVIDTAVLSESLSLTVIGAIVTDSFSASSTLATTAAFSLIDSFAATDAITGCDHFLADYAQAAEAASLSTVLSATDASTLQESLSLLAILPTVTDTIAATDAISFTTTLGLSDSFAAADLLIVRSVALFDLGLFSESLSYTAALSVTDSFLLSESMIGQPFSVAPSSTPDTATASDSSLALAEVSPTDSITASETATLTVVLSPVIDLLIASDLLAKPSPVYSLADMLYASDSARRYRIA